MRFWKDERGVVFYYVTAVMLALFGLVGLSIDSGRLFTLRQEMQQAADAAALAGAWQLDGTLAGSQKADVAARTTPVVANNQKFGNTAGAVTIATSNFWRAVPASDDTALSQAAPPYDYIEVTTTAVVQNPLLMRAVGRPGATTLTARAVARKGQARCQQTPLFMCLPTPATFDAALWIGHQVLMKSGGGGSWTPGNWGLLDVPGGNNLQNLPALSRMIAGTNGLPICISSSAVDTAPGNKDALTTAFNVRFDMYENPHASNYKTLPNYPPAENVVKGKTPNANCNNFNDTPRLTRMPQDTVIDPTTRFGNGQWDCLSYWNTNHPGGPAAPSGCADAATTTLTRYEIYLHEVVNIIVPDTTGNSPAGDDGDPQCYTGGPIPPTPTAPSQRINDRRILTLAGVDCSALAINGNTSGVPVQQYLSMFLTEPAITAGGANKGDVYGEIVGYDANGGGGLVPVQLREWVELVR